MTLDEFETILCEQKASGLSQKNFCAKRGIKISNFAYWKRRRRQSVQSEPGFVEIMTQDSEVSIEVYLAHELFLRVHPGFDEDHLVRLVRVLSH